MKTFGIDTGLYPQSSVNIFSPSPSTEKYFYYLTWCGSYTCTDHYFKRRDYYDHALVCYIKKGRMHLEYDGRIYTPSRHDVVLIDCRKPHYYRAYEGLQFDFIHFRGMNTYDLCERALEMHGPIVRLPDNQRIEACISEISNYYEESMVLRPARDSYLIYTILMLLNQENSFSVEEKDPIEVTMQYIYEHLSETLSVEELADMAGLSKYHYIRSFKKRSGYTPIEYQTESRLSYSKGLLVSTGKSIEEISDEVGYLNPTSFIRMFRKMTGMTPFQYRKDNKEGM